MRVKPYAIRFPSRNARHTALSAPGACMSTSGCSCRYRSSLRTCSGGPGGTSCTAQYRYPASGQRNGFPKSPATRHRRRGYERALRPHGHAGAHDKPRYHLRIRSRCQAAPVHHRTAGYRRALVRLPRRRLDAGQPTLMHAADSACGLSWSAEALERSSAHRGWVLSSACSAWIGGGQGAVAGCRRSRRAAHGMWGGRVQGPAPGLGRRHDRVGALSFAGCGAVAVPGRWHMQRWLCCMRNR